MPADPATEPSDRACTYAPIDVTGVVVAFNVTDTQTDQRITDMTLTPRLVAMLLAGTQSGGPGTHLFQDPEFVALNPGPHVAREHASRRCCARRTTPTRTC